MINIKRISAIILLASFMLLQDACRQEKEKKEDITDAAMEMIPFSAGGNIAEPFLMTDSSNNVFLSFIEKRDSLAELRFSKFDGYKWMPPVTIASGTGWFVNWADYPKFISNGKNDFIASTLVKNGKDTYAYDIKLFRSPGGALWLGPFDAHNDGTAAEHGFLSFAAYEDKILAVWLDGRNTQKKKNTKAAHVHIGSMTIRAALFDYMGKKHAEWQIDDRVCDCCMTALCIGPTGPIVAYRDRSDDEVRDISISRLIGKKWTSPRTLHADNWRIDGCPVNGPAMDANGSTIAIAWYAEVNGKAEVKVIFSEDGGTTLGLPTRIDEGKPIGRVDICMIDGGNAWISWMEQEKIKLVRLNARGEKSKSVTIASSSVGRSAGFPQMTRVGKDLLFAWTDDRKGSTIRTARFNTESLDLKP